MRRIAFGWDKGVLVLLVATLLVGWMVNPRYASASNLGFAFAMQAGHALGARAWKGGKRLVVREGAGAGRLARDPRAMAKQGP